MSRRQWMLAGMTRMKSTNIGKQPVDIRNTWKRAVAALQLGFPWVSTVFGLGLFLCIFPGYVNAARIYRHSGC